MRKFLFFTLLLLYISSSLIAQDTTIPYSRAEIDSKIAQSLQKSNQALNWSDMEMKLLWSTLIRFDSIAIIGFKPADFGHGRQAINDDNFSSEQWLTARSSLKSTIRTAAAGSGISITESELFPIGKKSNRPYIYAKVFTMDLLEDLLENNNIRYVEPANYEYQGTAFRSGEGCSDYSTVIDPSDYVGISPSAIASWTQAEHGIDLAWNKSNKGENVWIAVLDSGISANNPKFNAEFDEGDSANRLIEKKEFYAPNGTTDGWQDQCGHGTAMAGLALGTRGFDNTPAGVSYKANLISYRVTNDVIINNSSEIDGVHDALFDAGDDTRISIISMSLGDVFSHGPVEDGIIYAHDKGKLIFAAAGTSTSFTNWYGVIAPANMPEAIAITGVIEGSNFQKCDNCHSGNEVEFCVFMERSVTGKKAVSLSDDNVANNNFVGYVGGSSSSTAIMAGIAGLVKSNNPSFSKDQIINRLIQTSSNYPSKDSDYGWGTIDVCAAVDSTLSLPCSSSISNDISMQINTITFPPVNDGIGDPELVLKIGGKSYFFNVPSSGVTGNPNAFIDVGVCDNVPIIIDLGTSTCGTASIDLSVETHEDDGFSSECDFENGDDYQVITTETILFNANTFTQSTPNGDWVFTYSLTCSPTLVAGITSNSPICSGDAFNLTGTPVGQSSYNFFLDANNNQLLDAGESLQNSLSENFSSTNFAQGDVIGLEVMDSNGCSSFSFVTVQIINYTGSNTLAGVETGIADYETNDTIVSLQLIDNAAVVDYDAGVEISLELGFEVIQGAVFSAFIDGCNGGLGGENLQIKESQNK